MSIKPTSIVIAIDTDSYAGNFEREMCAYVTGMVGECDVGHDIAKKVENQIDPSIRGWYEDHVVREADDHGCHRPCYMWPTREDAKNYGYGAVAIFVNEKPTKEVVADMLKRAKEFASDPKLNEGCDIEIKSLRIFMPKLVKPCQIEHKQVKKYKVT